MLVQAGTARISSCRINPRGTFPLQEARRIRAKGNVTVAIPDPVTVKSFFIRTEPLADADNLPDPSPVTYQRIR